MKKSVITFFDKIIVLLLGFSGIFSGCDDSYSPVEYGVPHADYELKGVITAKETAKPIPNIMVIRSIYENFGDTLYTDSGGKYAFEFNDFPPHPEGVLHLKIEDIDGEDNGGFFGTKEINVEFTQADQVKKGKSWYDGKFVKTQNIELEKIDVVHPEYGVFPSAFKP